MTHGGPTDCQCLDVDQQMARRFRRHVDQNGHVAVELGGVVLVEVREQAKVVVDWKDVPRKSAVQPRPLGVAARDTDRRHGGPRGWSDEPGQQTDSYQ